MEWSLALGHLQKGGGVAGVAYVNTLLDPLLPPQRAAHSLAKVCISQTLLQLGLMCDSLWSVR